MEGCELHKCDCFDGLGAKGGGGEGGRGKGGEGRGTAVRRAEAAAFTPMERASHAPPLSQANFLDGWMMGGVSHHQVSAQLYQLSKSKARCVRRVPSPQTLRVTFKAIGGPTVGRTRCCPGAQALLCAYVAAKPEGSLSPEQLTQLAHAVRLAHLTPYFLAEVSPRVGWLCAGGREAAVQGMLLARMGAPPRTGTPAAWLPSAPARTGMVDSASRPVEWEVPLAQLQPLVDRVAAGGSSLEELDSPSTASAFGLGWEVSLQVTPVDAKSTARPRAVQLGLFLTPRFKHVPTPPPTAKFRWVIVGRCGWLLFSLYLERARRVGRG